jgi:hypothetical protein
MTKTKTKLIINFTDEKRILKLIPKGNKKAAKILLSEFNARGNELTWDSNGTLFIDQVSIPGSNMYFLFPILFKKKQSLHLPGLQQLISKINDMGLSDFINNSQMQMTHNAFSSRNLSEKDAVPINETEKWWYLGP